MRIIRAAVLLFACLSSAAAQVRGAQGEEESAPDPIVDDKPAPPTWQTQCARHCAHDNNSVAKVALETSCENYRYILPRPTVYRICKTAFGASRPACVAPRRAAPRRARVWP